MIDCCEYDDFEEGHIHAAHGDKGVQLAGKKYNLVWPMWWWEGDADPT